MRNDTLRGEIPIHPDNLLPAVRVREQEAKLSRTLYENVCTRDGVELLTRYPGNNYFSRGDNFYRQSRVAYGAFQNLSGEGAKGADKIHFYEGHGASHALMETKEVDFRFSVVPL
jgi:hypothetical protein